METVLSLVLLMCLPLYTEQGSACSILSPPNNGQVTGGNQAGDTVTYTCSTGYILTGSATRDCDGMSNVWTGSEPSCNARVLGDSCSKVDDCSTLIVASTCISSKCACKDGYTEKSGECEESEGLSGGAVAAIVVGSICAVAVIGVVIGVVVYKLIC